MTPAALKALLEGDAENFIAASMPGGIEAQEKRGQIEQSFLETLPIELRGKEVQFEALGFVLGDKIDDLFRRATFPKGWRKKVTDHQMWTDVVDDKGRVRAGIFYKAAFYDQRAHADLTRRFMVESDWNNHSAKVVDQMGIVTFSAQAPGKGDGATLDAIKNAQDWLTANYPGWQDPIKHWD